MVLIILCELTTILPGALFIQFYKWRNRYQKGQRSFLESHKQKWERLVFLPGLCVPVCKSLSPPHRWDLFWERGKVICIWHKYREDSPFLRWTADEMDGSSHSVRNFYLCWVCDIFSDPWHGFGSLWYLGKKGGDLYWSCTLSWTLILVADICFSSAQAVSDLGTDRQLDSCWIQET